MRILLNAHLEDAPKVCLIPLALTLVSYLRMLLRIGFIPAPLVSNAAKPVPLLLKGSLRSGLVPLCGRNITGNAGDERDRVEGNLFTVFKSLKVQSDSNGWKILSRSFLF